MPNGHVDEFPASPRAARPELVEVFSRVRGIGQAYHGDMWIIVVQWLRMAEGGRLSPCGSAAGQKQDCRGDQAGVCQRLHTGQETFPGHLLTNSATPAQAQNGHQRGVSLPVSSWHGEWSDRTQCSAIQEPAYVARAGYPRVPEDRQTSYTISGSPSTRVLS